METDIERESKLWRVKLAAAKGMRVPRDARLSIFESRIRHTQTQVLACRFLSLSTGTLSMFPLWH